VKKVKVALGYPWYAGADRDCVTNFLCIQQYLGRLMERLWWLNHSPLGTSVMSELPPLDRETPAAEIPMSLIGTEFEFAIADEVGCSLPGMARERIVEKCLEWGADYIMWSDSDMAWGTDAFLRLYLDDKPIVGALAFTGRVPITPVIYKFENYGTEVDDRGMTHIKFDAKPVPDYERDALQKVDAIGSGVMLIKAETFRTIPKPWFTSYGIGEDIYFCARAAAYKVPVYVDTRVKTAHKPTFHHKWHDEVAYDAQRVPEVVPV
jgi:hypothetical protein